VDLAHAVSLRRNNQHTGELVVVVLVIATNLLQELPLADKRDPGSLFQREKLRRNILRSVIRLESAGTDAPLKRHPLLRRGTGPIRWGAGCLGSTLRG